MAKHTPQAERTALHNLLRAVREEATLTQVEFAKKLRRPQSYVSKSESGERELGILELRQWCRASGLTLSAFATRLEKLL